jgi:hypothetical protein
VSDAPQNKPAPKISMAKKPSSAAVNPSGGSDKPDRPAAVPIPRTIQLATAAVIGEIVFTLAHALAARGFTSQLLQLMKHANDTAKKPVKNFDAVKQLSDYRTGLLVQGLVICVAMVILGLSLRRARGASGARWAILIVLVLTAQSNGPFAVFPISDYPGTLQVLRSLIGVSSIALIVCLLLPESMRYFRACKAATRPEGAPARAGLGALFGPRGAGASRGGVLGARTATRGGGFGARGAARAKADAAGAAEAEAIRPSDGPRGRAKAKGRADADAVAKGAALARTRAKASKSRRTPETS